VITYLAVGSKKRNGNGDPNPQFNFEGLEKCFATNTVSCCRRKGEKSNHQGLQGVTSTKRYPDFNSEKNSCNVKGKKIENAREW
jgi:hypothetical protein